MDRVKNVYCDLIELIGKKSCWPDAADEMKSAIDECPEVLKYGARSYHGSLTCYACSSNNVHALRTLMKYGVNINANVGFGMTPLMISISTRANDCAYYLLNSGANLHKKDRKRWTALHCAAHCNNMGLFVRMIGLGASPNCEDRWGNTPVDIFLDNLKMRAIETGEFYHYLKSLKTARSRIDRSTVLDPVAPTETIPEI